MSKGSHGASIGQLDEETLFYMAGARDFGAANRHMQADGGCENRSGIARQIPDETAQKLVMPLIWEEMPADECERKFVKIFHCFWQNP